MTTTGRRRGLAALLSLALLPVLPAVAGAQETPVEVQPARAAGADRFETARVVAEATFTSATTAHLVTGESFPDALAAAYGAGVVDGPVLLSQRDDAPAATLVALDELGVRDVVLVGGTSVIGTAVQEQLVALGYAVSRVEGVDRYRTASALAMRYAGSVGSVDGRRTALLVSGQSFADALAAGPLAYALDLPLLLAERDRTDASVNETLRRLGVEQVMVVGGVAAISQVVEDFLAGEGYVVQRLAGPDRQATAVEVADFAVDRLGFSVGTSVIARGDDFPDALSAAPHAGVLRTPILLTVSPTQLGARTRQHLEQACPEVTAVRAIGGRAAVSTATLQAAVDAAEACSNAGQTADYVLAPQEPLTVTVGRAADLNVLGRFGDQPLGAVDLALFPCTAVDPTAEPLTFRDDDGDGLADGRGSTDTTAAFVDTVHTTDIAPGTTALDAVQPAAGMIPFTVTANAPDCAVAAVWTDQAAAGLPVDSRGRPTVGIGVSQLRFVSSGAVPAFEPADARFSAQPEGPELALRSVRVGAHEGFDRVVFELDGGGTPGFRAWYTDEPAYAGRGNQVDIEGTTAVTVSISGVGVPPQLEIPQYSGPDRLDGPGTSALEVVVGNVFEGLQGVYVGAPERRPYRVFRLSDPARVVVDIAHP